MAEKDFESAVKSVLAEENNRTALNQSLAIGSEYNPDEYAKKHALAVKAGVATRIVYDFPEDVERRQKIGEIQVGIDEILKTAPKTSTYLSANIDNAAISQDDIGILAKIERAFQTPVDIARSAVSNVLTTTGGQIAGSAKTDAIAERMSKIGLSERFAGAYEVMKFIAKGPKSVVDVASPVSREDWEKTGEGLKQIGREIDVPMERRTFTTDVVGGISQMLVQSLTAPLTGGTSLFYQGVDIMSDKVAKDNASQLAKDLTVVGAASFTSMLEKVGLDKVMSRIPKQAQTQLKAFLVDKLKAFGIEYTTELAENIVQDVARNLGTNPDAPIGEGALYESTVAGTAALIVRTAMGVKSYRQAKQQEQIMQDLANPVGQSTTRQRSPEKFQEFINEMTKDGPVQNIFIPQEQFAQYFQSQNRNPEDVAAQLGIKNYGEAELTGGDLVVPMNTFTTQVVPTTDLQGLMPDIRFRQGWATSRENQELQDSASEDAKRLAKEFEVEFGEREAGKAAYNQIKNDIEGQFIQLGTSRLEAEMYAEATAKLFKGVGYNTFKNIPKENVETLIKKRFAEMQFKVSMPRDSVLKDKKVDMQLDPLLDSLRSRMSFDEKKIYGPSLIDFLKMKKIKLDDSMGELAARDIDVGRKAFERKLIAEKGDEKAFGLEKAAEIAHSWGFIPETNEQLFLEALDEDLRGNSVYSSEFTDAKLEEYVNQLDALQEYLDRNNIDVNELSNEEIREKLAELAAQPEPEPDFYQREPKDLVVLHNLSIDNLRFIDEFGGLPVPSLGITKVDTPFKGFGDITLIGPKGMIDPAKGVPVFSADAYTARFPDLIWDKVSIKKADAFFKAFGEDYKEQDLADTWDRMVNYPDRNRAIEEFVKSGTAMRAWLKENGQTPIERVMTKDKPWASSSWFYDVNWYAKVKELIGRGIDVRNIRPEDEGYDELQYAAMYSAKQEASKFDVSAEEFFAKDITDGVVSFGAIDRGVSFVFDLDRPPRVDVVRTRDALRAQIGESLPAYEKWAADKIKGQFKEPSIKVGGRKVAVTLDNVVDAMATKVVRGREKTMTFSSGQVAARAAKQFRSIEEIQAARGKIVSSDVEAEFKSDTDAAIDGYMAIAGQYYRFDTGYPDASMKALAEASRSGGGDVSIKRALIKNNFEDPSEDLIKAGKDAIAAMRGAVTDYFEAKPQRAVMLYEFMGAVVPKNAPQDVVNILEKNGILVREYSQVNDETGEENRNQVISELAKDLDAETDLILFQKQPEKAEVNRGYVKFGKGKNKTVEIALLKDRDFSTYIHELGHVGLELFLDLTEDPAASQDAIQDRQKIFDFLGIKDRSEIGVEQHEKFARANEMYFLEGKAPSVELRPLFQRFKTWFMGIYRKLSELNVELSDDIREVFDRMYATEDEIELARSETELNPLFTTAESIGMTDDEFNAYQNSVSDEVELAKEKLAAKLMKEHYDRKKLWFKEKLDEERAKVAEEVKGMRVYVAFNRLKDPNDEVRLSKADLVDRYGAEFIKRLPRPYVYAKTGGMRVDDAAEMLGYDSGDALVKDLVEMKPMREYINAEARQRVIEEVGDIQTDGTFIDEARAALHNESRADVLAIELRALRRKQREVAPFVRAEKQKAKEAKKEALSATKLPTMAQFRAMAKGMIDAKQVRDITPYEYLMAERKHNREAFKAMAKGDYNAAFISKQKEMINHFMYLEGTKARDRIEKIRDYAASFDKKAKREKIAKAGKQFLEQIDTLLENYEFKRVTGVQLEQRQKLMDFIAEQEKAGNYVNLSPEMIDEANAKNYKQATYAELVSIEEGIRSIEHIARNENKILLGEIARDFENFKSELLTTVRDSKELRKDVDAFTAKPSRLKDKVAKTWRNWDASHLKTEQLFEWFDGGVKDGPWAKVFDIAAKAQTKEYDLHAKVTTSLADLQESMPENWKKSLLDMYEVELPNAAGQTGISKMQLIGIALNTGNEGNYARLKNGRGKGYEWSNEQITNALKNLRKEDWDFVQGVWDSVNLLWDDIVALEERMTGIAPPKVEAKEQTILNNYGESVTIKGGYFPIVYDRRYSVIGEKQADVKETLQDFINAQYSRATTSKGHTEGRVENYSAPLDFDWSDTLSYHVSSVIKDISHREAIKSLNKILRNSEIKGEIENRFGKEYVDMLNDWVVTLVMDRTDSMRSGKSWANLLLRTRTNMAIVTMGFKATTVLSQVAGIGPSFDFVSRRNFGNAMIEFANNPKAALDFVSEKSGEMRFRTSTLDRDVKDGLRLEKGQDGILAAVRRTAFYATGYMDMAVSIPTWIGAYKQSLIQGETELNAIAYADKAVRLSQGAAGGKDMAAIVANKGLMSLFTMYYTPFSALYSRLRDVGYQTNEMKDLPKQSARLLGLVIFPALVGALLSGQGPDEDEDKVWWAIRKTLLYPMTALIGLKDLTGMAEKWMIGVANDGKMNYKPSYNMSPVEGAIRKIIGIPDQLAKLATGKKDFDEVAWEVFETSGYIFGLPTAQVRITGEYLQRLLSGEENPNDAADVLKGLLFRPKKD